MRHFDYLTDPANLIQMKTGATAIAFAVILFSKYHRRSENLDSCPVDRDVWGHFVRLKLLAAIFRLPDALHIDRTRFPEAEFESLRLSPEFTETNRMHWIKSYIINTIRIDPSRYTVTIQADFPESPVGEASSPGDRIEDSMLTCAPALAVAQPFSTRTRRS